jgi:CSLREA domain-containing protein
MKHTIWLLGSIFMVALVFALSSSKPVAAETNLIYVNTTNDVVADDGFCSLREAIIAANTNIASGLEEGECPAGSATETDVILLTAGETYDLTIAGAGNNNAQTGDLDILNNSNVDVDIRVVAFGAGGAALVRSVGLNDRIWHVHGGAKFVLENVETRGGASTLGAGLYNDNGQVTLVDAMFSLNVATVGGAIANVGTDAFLTADNVQISRNFANTGSGGAISNLSGAKLLLTDSFLDGNTAQLNGGGVFNGSNALVVLTRTRVSGNEAAACGGGIANSGGTLTLMQSDVTALNKAGERGGGLCNLTGTVMISLNTTIELNESNHYGGGVFNGDVMTIGRSLVRGNKANDPGNDGDGGIGGGLYTTPGSQTIISRSAILDNTAATIGGGITAEGVLNVHNSTFSGNHAKVFGGGLLAYGGADVTLIHVTLADNTVNGLDGAGLYLGDGQLAVGNSIVANGGKNCLQSSGQIVSLGHNLSSDDTCPFDAVGDLNEKDPLLAELENGAHQLQPGSPAIDAGDTALCTEPPVSGVDQLGQARPKFNGCDIGAVEWQGFGLYLPAILRQ